MNIGPSEGFEVSPLAAQRVHEVEKHFTLTQEQIRRHVVRLKSRFNVARYSATVSSETGEPIEYRAGVGCWFELEAK